LISQVLKIDSISPILSNQDINGEFLIHTKDLTGHIKSIKELDYSEFYLTIWLEKGKIEIISDKILYYKKAPSKFTGYNIIKQYHKDTNIFKEYQLDAIKYLLECKDSKELLKSHIQNHKVIFQTIKEAKNETSN
jgi:hypothetical protein